MNVHFYIKKKWQQQLINKTRIIS